MTPAGKRWLYVGGAVALLALIIVAVMKVLNHHYEGDA
jgi:hypothetical protein